MSKSHPGHFMIGGESSSRTIGLKTEVPSVRFKMDQHQQVISSTRTSFCMTYKVHLKIKEKLNK
jgi:nitroimidazol reductase NimA-like FMN-containing flavoprotein (pyridoxamine 5'-phosphate oxidase superfamily)